MRLTEIAEKLNIAHANIPDTEISWLLTDSRSLSFPSETLFFALETAINDGHKFIPELYQRNVRYFVINKEISQIENMPEAVFLRVDNTLDALQKIAITHRNKFEIPIVGITGSNGKTVVKEWLYQLLNKDFNITRSPKSYNSQIGVPLSVWSLSEKTELGIFEAGISQMGEMEKLQPIINPAIGLFTNLGDAHSKNFSSQSEKAKEKLKLFINSEVLIYNLDNELLSKNIEDAQLNAKLFSWGKNRTATLQILNVEKNDFTTLTLGYGDKKFEVSIPFSDDASLENAMQCICIMLYFNYSTKKIAERMLLLQPVEMRLEVKKGVKGCLIINDTYNSDINSLEIALNFLNQQAVKKKLSRTLILSDIQESRLKETELYAKVANLIKNKGIKKIIGVGQVISSMAENFEIKEKYFFKNTEELLKSSLIQTFQNEIILLKGARIFQFESVLERLEFRVHETTLDVNLNALIGNFNYFRSKLRKETKTVCMVKASAYGSGAVEVAVMLQNSHCDYFGVAVADEGAELRRAGIHIPIIVMNPEELALRTIIDYRLEPEIYSFRMLELFLNTAEKMAVSNYPIHIKIDTGMHRLGFEEKDMPKLIQELKRQNLVKIQSVFSHLAGADSSEFDDFTYEQIETFQRCSDMLMAAFPYQIIRHILNSAGIERFPQFQFEMVRIGIGLYQISSIPNVSLETVSTLKTVVLQIRDIKAYDTVGYSRKGKITKNSRIGVIPIGYADGLDRRLSNGVGEVWVNGQRAKVVGNICMDACMIDLTGIDVKEGDTVEIFGEHISIEEIAKKLNTIPYEVLTNVSPRVKRVYFID